jgi:hypothetical protein
MSYAYSIIDDTLTLPWDNGGAFSDEPEDDDLFDDSMVDDDEQLEYEELELVMEEEDK